MTIFYFDKVTIDYTQKVKSKSSKGSIKTWVIVSAKHPIDNVVLKALNQSKEQLSRIFGKNTNNSTITKLTINSKPVNLGTK